VERSTDRLAPDTDTALLDNGYATVTVITAVREVPTALDLEHVVPPRCGEPAAEGP